MSFSFGTPSSSSASADNATTTAPASGGLFGNVSGGAPKFSFAKVGGSSGSDANTNTTPSNNTGFLFAQKPAGNIFGGDGSSNTNSTPTAGASTTPSIGGLFGEGNTTPATSTPAASSSEASGGGSSGAFAAAIAAAKPASGGLFGGGPSSTGASSGASQSQSTTTETAKPSLFANTGTSLFGNKAGIASATSAQSTAPATAEATPPKSLFALPSTTPAGAPPGDTSQPTSTTATSASALFGGAAAKPTTPTTSTPAAPSGLFSGAQAGGGSFAGNMFGNKAATTTEKPAASLFGAAAGSAPSSSSPAADATKATTGSASSLFGAKPAATTTPETSTATSGGFLSGNAKSAAETPGATTTSTSGGLFGKPATPTSTAGQLFGAKSTADTANKDENQSKEEPKPATQNSAASALGASTAGPTSQMARLKNKTMEDIVTRWASDLTKYQKEFKEQATTVSSWDRSLVDNGEKIQKLYLDTFEAERASHEIERQLAAVESQQEELEAWLNRYESEIQDMFAKQVGPGEQLAGPDQERERTYKLAEKLTQHLDEKSRDLSKMVKEINDISGTLSKGAKTEDPLSQIVRVLNGHLTQLQWIDVNASALQAKVTAAQKSSSSLSSHYAGPESDAAEGFYRSYYGRR